MYLLQPPLQRDFETRLEQQLDNLDSSIRRNFDKLFTQHLGMATASICNAHADSHERLKGGLLDLACVVQRLEAKLDHMACVQHCPPESQQQQRRSAARAREQGLAWSAVIGDETSQRQTVELDRMFCKHQRNSGTDSLGSISLHETEARSLSRLAKIDVVCPVDISAAVFDTRTKFQPKQVLNQILLLHTV
jgi:hypothetical protein